MRWRQGALENMQSLTFMLSNSFLITILNGFPWFPLNHRSPLNIHPPKKIPGEAPFSIAQVSSSALPGRSDVWVLDRGATIVVAIAVSPPCNGGISKLQGVMVPIVQRVFCFFPYMSYSCW